MNFDDSRTMLGEGLREILKRIWPPEQAATMGEAPESLIALWAELCGNDIAALSEATDLAVVARELGRAGAALPQIGAAAIQRLDPPGLVEEVAIGRMRVAIAFVRPDELEATGSVNGNASLAGAIQDAEDWAVATHLLIIPASGSSAWLVDRDAAGLTSIETPGLCRPSLSRLTLDRVPARSIALGSDIATALIGLARLLLVARATGAARRGLELATDYVQLREQFGQPVGRFQALQHKLADCLVAIDVAELMVANAADALDRGGGVFEVDALLSYASPALRQTMLELHHSFGAIGYSEEHELPRHFRRVHSDTTRLGGAAHARQSLGRKILTSTGFPQLAAGEGLDGLRTNIRNWLDRHWTESDRQAARARPFQLRDSDPDFVRLAGSDGWLAINWPREHGGANLTPLEQLVFVEETDLAGAPFALSRAGSWIIAPALIQHGSEAQKAELLPAIARGEIRFFLGYSEPQAGSDLASLRTRAMREGDDFVINGQKMWGTLAETATHIFLAARTDPDAKPKHAGVSLFVVPTDTPGIEIRPGLALYGRTFSTTFLDDVRVPATSLVGPLNGGWKVLTSALASERVLMGGQVARMRKLLEELAAQLAARADDPVVVDRLGGLAADLQAARLLSLRSVELLQAGAPAMVEGAISKLFTGNLAERLGETALELVGTPALLSEDAPDAPLDGAIEQHLRFSIMTVIGGGTAEIQRTLIAQRGLGLPR